MDAGPSQPAHASHAAEAPCADEGTEDAPPPPPLSNPPVSHRLLTHKYDNLDDILGELDAFAASAGFSIVRKNSANRVDGFGPTSIRIECACGQRKASKAQSRNSSTKKRDCPWYCQLQALKDNGRLWTMKIGKSSQHDGHEPSFRIFKGFPPECQRADGFATPALNSTSPTHRAESHDPPGPI